jgi:N-acetylmuramoyl-L-alanine amidase
MKRFRTAAARRQKLRRVLPYAGGAVLLAVVATALALTVPRSAQQAGAGTLTTGTAAMSTTSTVTTETEDTSTSGTAATLPVSVATSSTTMPLQTTTSSTTAPSGNAGDYVVVIDPGHQAKANYGHEPVGPGSAEMKDKVSSGTHSINTGAPESQLVLAVSLGLRDSLQANGIRVVMTRTAENVDVSNVQRAQIANEAGADLFVRIHADGAADTSIHGILMLYPATIKGWTDDIAAQSKQAASLALDSLISATGARNRGMVARSDMTGFNWSDVPVILPEIGLMTNPAEDALLATEEYRSKIVQGLTDAILDYLGLR